MLHLSSRSSCVRCPTRSRIVVGSTWDKNVQLGQRGLRSNRLICLAAVTASIDASGRTEVVDSRFVVLLAYAWLCI